MNSREDSTSRARRGLSSAAEVPAQDMTYTSFGSTVASGGTIPPPRPPTAIGAVPNPDPPKQPEEMAPTPGGAAVVAVPSDTRSVTAQTWAPELAGLVRGAIFGAITTGAAIGTLLAADGDVSLRAIVAVAMVTFFGPSGMGYVMGRIDEYNSTRV